MPTTTIPARDPAIEAEVLSKAVVRAADLLGLTRSELAQVLGLSEAAVNRLYRREIRLQPEQKEFELALHLVRLFRALDSILGGDEKAMQAWMRAPNRGLGGIPAEMITSTRGLADVLNYLDARRAVV